MKHPYHEEVRTPEQIRLSKNAYKKRKIISKKKRVKSEKLKRKKEKRLQLKEANAPHNSKDPNVPEDKDHETALVRADGEVATDKHTPRQPINRASPTEDGLVDGSVSNETGEDGNRKKKKAKKRKRHYCEDLDHAPEAHSKDEEDNQATIDTGKEETIAKTSTKQKRRKVKMLRRNANESDDPSDGSEGREEGTSGEEEEPSSEGHENGEAQTGGNVNGEEASAEKMKEEKKKAKKRRRHPTAEKEKSDSTLDDDEETSDIGREKASEEEEDRALSEAGAHASAPLESTEKTDEEKKRLRRGIATQTRDIEAKGSVRDSKLKKKKSNKRKVAPASS